MAAPCALYLAKIVLPETESTHGLSVFVADSCVKSPYRNLLDALSTGTSDGLGLAINGSAMLISFLALLAMVDASIFWLSGGWDLASLMGEVFRPIAILSSFTIEDAAMAGELLGKKLITNKFIAFTQLNQGERFKALSAEGRVLAYFALCGFANLSSIGVQIGGMGAMIPSRRGDWSSLGPQALLVGFLATLINAALASFLLH